MVDVHGFLQGWLLCLTLLCCAALHESIPTYNLVSLCVSYGPVHPLSPQGLGRYIATGGLVIWLDVSYWPLTVATYL